MFLAIALFAVPKPFAYDLIIRGGTVMDGSGKTPFVADVAIKDDKIAAIGPHLTDSMTFVDAKGLVVAPGFIDVHTHAENILKLPKAENFVRNGVTSLVIGNCGGSTLDVKKFFSDLKAAKPALNIATLVGHNSVRHEGMGGDFDRAPTKAEREKMEALVRKAMQDGAVGFSTGLEYVPGTYSKTPEVVELAKIAAEFGGLYTTHMRSEGKAEKEALEESFEIGRQAHIPVHISHIKLDAKPYWGEAKERMKQILDARNEGIRVTEDVYPYTAYSTTLGLLLPSAAFDGGKDALRKRIADPDELKKIEDGMANLRVDSGEPDYGWVAIASNQDTRLNGLRIPQAAKLVSGSDSLDSQIKLLLKLVQEGSSGVFFAMNEDDLEYFARDEHTMFISDSVCESLASKELPHPRAYGSDSRVLAYLVRERHVLDLPEAIRRMTSLPAEMFKIRNRGLLKEGNWADVVVFDPDKVQDKATYPNPRVYPAGIAFVLVNGKEVVAKGQQTEQGPGRPILRDTP